MLRELRALSGGRLHVAVGDITEFSGAAIVNAANSSLLGGGGVDGAIHRAGGPAILEECRALRAGPFKAGLPPGRAVATGAGRLKARAVIHTVGPVWAGGRRGEADVLASCYRSCLEIAGSSDFESLAFPAISTGAYGYPRAEAARVAHRTITAHLEAHRKPCDVWLIFYSEAAAQLFLDTITPGGLPESRDRSL
ncbi:MAG TPA: O-acetyl-ADP-ribose deacetylase [Rectinemataceae bacterium]|nr:O-acetyl-ADP-ribose deacetylase [Rectinemataceae bacterium]